jgi:dolichol-phosphate mannosyltransferase
MQTFVVPAYDEALNIPRLLADLESRPALWAGGGRLLIVDDGSSDDTVAVAQAYDGPLPVEVLVQPRNMGPGRAFDRGFRRALELCTHDEDLIITLEADTTSDLDALAQMFHEAHAGADLVLASVHAGGELVGVGRRRAALSRAAAAVIRHSAGLDARTVSSFFRVYRAGILRNGYARFGDDLIQERGFACKAELLAKLMRVDATVVEVPISLDASRRQGESKLRVLPTVAGYTRLVGRQVAYRMGVGAR